MGPRLYDHVFDKQNRRRGFLNNQKRNNVVGKDKESDFAVPEAIFTANVNKGIEPDTIKDHMKNSKGLENSGDHSDVA